MRRVIYRSSQVWAALVGQLSPAAIAQVREQLSDSEAQLFARLQPSEQYHAWRVWRHVAQHHALPRSVAAGCLLHDVGKCHMPLQLWERVWIVLGRAVLPHKTRFWGRIEQQPNWWQRAFVSAEQHPQWGASLASAAGSAPLTVWLIRYHQQSAATAEPDWLFWLHALQQADDAT